MDKALAIQMRRGRKRLQLVILPYEVNTDTSALMRLNRVDGKSPAGWRAIGGIGMALHLEFDGLTDTFKADASLEEVLQSPWISGDDRVTEVAGLVDFLPSDTTDIRMHRLPSGLLQRISEEIPGWA